ncbi:MAG TPA: hypothetical protein VD886_19265 [Herpetosiphonaceae bacterium]|nr:hypothetical protein [Herpetosiphonaceae bacterium]
MNRKVLGCLAAGALALSGCGEAAPTAVPTTIPAPPTTAAAPATPTVEAAPAGGEVNFSDPVSVAEAVFAAAQSEDYSQLAGLCDPQGQNDKDTQMICDLTADETERGSFVTAFAKGKVAGPAAIATEGSDQIAEVPIVFGPDGDQEETLKLVQRDGKWYLSGF